MFDKVGRFFSEVKVELTKVSWPNRQELVAST
ncbi:MAG: preprotein translocase subunit SecE, partial [Candidatus Omnitrophica bacterium]|nr:preprotein translocase subunit SecE [Candidatus Omnitrophota bacterium]